MKTNRPKIKVPLETIDIILDLISITLLILMIVYVAMSYQELPEIIPSHFNGKGEVDGHSEKSMLWLLPGISVAMFIGLFILNKYPHLHNYMVNITEENALKNYRFSTRILRITNVFMALLFFVISYSMIQGAKNEGFELGSWFFPVVIGFSILLPIGILIYNHKINKS
ncbi:DUF1648 domain-containing protein [Psychroserpens algicola]|uniref:DUF1648 domain-containing protein n=1 Tax=Psychroserpens algicola TaxID=1719034 RepID=A0ABT0H756_9FLAO|nr:DUF1648 domain-containing protein [Psychroserpens algicola]MCK8480195.1 DUF1648 domain-containing protein [Psychroserpens algicola]